MDLSRPVPERTKYASSSSSVSSVVHKRHRTNHNMLESGMKIYSVSCESLEKQTTTCGHDRSPTFLSILLGELASHLHSSLLVFYSGHINDQRKNKTQIKSIQRKAKQRIIHPRVVTLATLHSTRDTTSNNQSNYKGQRLSQNPKLIVSFLRLALFILCIRGVESLPTSDLSAYDPLCGSVGQKIPAVWSCQGYIQCLSQSSARLRAVWTECGVGLLFDPSRLTCVSGLATCMSAKDTAGNICPTLPRLKLPHPASCALYFDCNRPRHHSRLAPWENECPSPLVFDERNLSCVEKTPNLQICAGRQEPRVKCDYRLGCQDKNCTGLEDGAHFDPWLPFSASYYLCKNGTVLLKKACEEDGHFFDAHTRECTDAITEESVQAFCSKNPTAIFPDPSRCSLLFDCSQPTWHSNLKPYQTECAYPRLFDTESASCANFMDVKCGSRLVAVQPCDYIVGHCVDAGCIPCVASCLGLRDGPNAYPGRVLTAFFLVCQRERTIDIQTCPDGSIFEPQMRACLTEISGQTLDIYCTNNPNGRLVHPSECSIFYSCNQSNSTQVNPNLPPRAIECKYPYLVDSGTMTCRPHTLVKCGARREPFSPCDYVSNRCTSKDCTRCELVMPSCFGKSDNYYPAINQEMSAHYIICKDQRVMGAGVCPNGTIFDIRTLTCTDSVYSLSLVEYCTSYRTGRVQNPANCAQYYDCAASLKDVSECTYPDLYDFTSHLCLPYSQVDCAGRPVFLEPCQ